MTREENRMVVDDIGLHQREGYNGTVRILRVTTKSKTMELELSLALWNKLSDSAHWFAKETEL